MPVTSEVGNLIEPQIIDWLVFDTFIKIECERRTSFQLKKKKKKEELRSLLSNQIFAASAVCALLFSACSFSLLAQSQWKMMTLFSAAQTASRSQRTF